MSAVQTTQFKLVLERFKHDLSDPERADFQFTSLNDLKVALDGIQKRQTSERRLQAMDRLNRFLEAMENYDKVIKVFLNSTEFLAFVWV